MIRFLLTYGLYSGALAMALRGAIQHPHTTWVGLALSALVGFGIGHVGFWLDEARRTRARVRKLEGAARSYVEPPHYR